MIDVGATLDSSDGPQQQSVSDGVVTTSTTRRSVDIGDKWTVTLFRRAGGWLLDLDVSQQAGGLDSRTRLSRRASLAVEAGVWAVALDWEGESQTDERGAGAGGASTRSQVLVLVRVLDGRPVVEGYRGV